jgi:glutaredoxin 3
MSGNEVIIYTTRFCPYCIRAKQLLTSKNVVFKEIPVDGDPALREEMARKSGRQTVPQIWIGDTHVGGCDDLFALEKSKQLDELLM